jgi:hypothetical protein
LQLPVYVQNIQDDLMAAAIPFYRSPQTIGLITTFIAAAVALFPKAGQLLGLTSPTEIATAVSNIAGLVALVAPVIGTIFRVKQSSGQPITLTQAGADAHPATLAAEAAAAPARVILPDPVTQPIPAAPTAVKPAVPVVPGKPWGKP